MVLNLDNSRMLNTKVCEVPWKKTPNIIENVIVPEKIIKKGLFMTIT